MCYESQSVELWVTIGRIWKPMVAYFTVIFWHFLGRVKKH